MSNNDLSAHYQHWNEYVRSWFDGQMPDRPHMPEPWWGWSPAIGKPLYSVVLNLSPGEGGDDKKRESVADILSRHTYQQAVNDPGLLPKHLPATQKWHVGTRARTIISRLPEAKITDHNYTNHYLSVEMGPHHAKTAVELEEYVAAHPADVLQHALQFAADASTHIPEGSPLHNVVIVRCSARRFINICRLTGVKAAPDPATEKPVSPCWMQIDDPRFKDISFVCLWGARNFLPKNDLNQIIKSKINS